MNAEQTRKLQLTQLEIMDELHRICVKNDIKYYIVGGTALGAVRHKGFIPWDVDIDVAMSRVDYARFKEACVEELNSRFIYRDYTNTKEMNHSHALLCIKNTRLITRYDKYNPKAAKREIFLDIFPFDTIPADKRKQAKQARKLMSLLKTRYYKIAESYDDRYFKSLAKRLLGKSIFWTSVYDINKKLDEIMRQYNHEKSGCLGYIGSTTSFASYEKQCLREEILGVPKLMQFEQRQYYAPEQVEVYLARLYGDYMELPAERERQNIMNLFTEAYYDRTDKM